MNVARLLEEIEFKKCGLWAVANDPICQNLLAEYRRYGVLTPSVENALSMPLALPLANEFERYFKNAYGNQEHYLDQATWGLYWAVTRATHLLFDLIAQNSLEPELNGALLAAVSSEIKQARLPASALGKGDFFAVHFSNQAALGNEARSGSDFGVIIERRSNGQKEYRAALIQAKRAKARKVSVHRAAGETTQRSLLEAAGEGVGAFLFYNEFGAEGIIPPTVMSASLLTSHQTNTVDTLDHTHDFAAWFAFGFPSGSVVGPQQWLTREGALDCVFRRNGSGARVNNLLIAVLDEERLSPLEVGRFALEWARLIERARREQRTLRSPPERDSASTEEQGDGFEKGLPSEG